jgi:outer membrane protein assembly factor BamB
MRAGAIEIAMVSLTIVLIISAGCSNTSTSPGAELSPSNKDQTFNNAKSTPPPAAAEVMFRANAQHTGVYDNKEGIEPVDTYIWGFATEGIIHSSPAVANGVVYVGSLDRNLYAIDAMTGKEKWRFTTGNSVYSSPAVANGVVYVGSMDGNLYAIDGVTGKEKWRFTTGNRVYSSPAVANGVVYVGSCDDNLYAIDALTGKEKWRFTTGKSWVYGVLSSPAVANGVVYVGSDTTYLYAIGQRSKPR